MKEETPEPPADEPTPEPPAEEPNPLYPPLELDTPEVDWFKRDAGERNAEKRDDH
jgi:hypothetical protein